MTRLDQRKTKLSFETQSTIFEQGEHRAVIVECHPKYALLRLKGKRKGYSISWDAMVRVAARLEKP